MRRWRTVLIVALATLATGCAWTNRDNRPVWNAFEAEVVPEDPTWFALSLPLTVPGGIVAILADTFVVHPASVVDDAFDDAVDLWRDLDFEHQYYTQLAVTPLRAAATPVWFAGSFLGRSAFDVTPESADVDPERQAALDAEAAQSRRRAFLTWLGAIANGGTETKNWVTPPPWDAELADAFERARRDGTALGRHALFQSARWMELPPLVAAPWLGLLDADPVVRYLELDALGTAEPPVDVREALRNDPVESVRQLARRRWP